MTETIGIAGCGTMGLPMAERLFAAGYEVWGHDVRPTAEFGAFQPRMIANPKEFAAKCDIVFSVVRDKQQTLDLCFGPAQGILTGDVRPGVFVTCSTLSPRFVGDLAERIDARTQFADAPMSGAPFRAANGTLTFMVGGDAVLVERLVPLFATMGEAVHHLGGVGTGMACKVVNNSVAVAEVVAVRRALKAAEALGLDRRRLLDVMTTSSGGTWYGNNFDAIDWSRQGYAPGNTIGILEKDLLAFVDALPGGAAEWEDCMLDELRMMTPVADLPRRDDPEGDPA